MVLKEWKAVWGKIRLCEKAFPAFQGSKDAPKDAKKEAPKKEAPKKEAPKKEAAKKETPSAEEVLNKKNPLDLLPPTDFNFFDYKTLIVNAKDKKEAIQFLWDNVDVNGFSLWKVYYEKYEGEGEKLFMTNNLANGFLQRLEHFRKYIFGAWGVYGEEPNLEIRGNACI